MMQYRKVEDRTERSVLVRKIRNIPFYDSHSISVLDKSVTGSLDHLRIEVDRRNTSGTEILDLSGNTFARSTANVEDFEPLGTPAQCDELRNHTSSQSLGSQATVDVNGLRPIHLHPRNSMTSLCREPGGGTGPFGARPVGVPSLRRGQPPLSASNRRPAGRFRSLLPCDGYAGGARAL